MSLSKDHAIIAQNAATAAATLLQGTGADLATFEATRTAIFNGTLVLGQDPGSAPAPVAPVAPVVSAAEAAPPVPVAPVAAPVAPAPSVLGGGYGGGSDNGAGVAFKFGKFAGQTIEQVGAQKPDYLVWVKDGGMSNNSFMTGKVTEYLNANPHVEQAGRQAQAQHAA